LLGDSQSGQVWDLATDPQGDPVVSARGLSLVAFRPDGKALLTNGDRLRLWDVPSGKPLVLCGGLQTSPGTPRALTGPRSP